jgi:O-antigen/teichoic acid export membrane protein
VLSNTLLGCARGFGRMDHAALAENVIQSTVRMALLGVLAVVGMDVQVAVIVFGLADVSAALTLVVLLTPQLPQPWWKRQPVRHDVTMVMRFALPLWISGLIAQFSRNIQAVFLGALATVASVGVYAIVNRINLLGHVMYRSVIAAVKPILARLHDAGDREGLQRVYTASSRWTLAANVPFFLLMVLYPEPILAVFGDAFTSGAEALVVLAFAELVLASTGICGSILDMTGHTRMKLVNSVLAVATLVVTNALFIPRWGIVGAAFAALVGTVVVESARVLEVWFLERVHPYGPGTWKPYTAGLTAVGLGLLLGWVWPVGTSLVVMLPQATLVIGTYVGLIVAFGVAEDDRLVLDRVLARARRGRRRTGATARATP